MKNNTKIKVIKKKDIGKTNKPIAIKRDSGESTSNKIVATISVWIEESNQKRFENAKSAMEGLNRPQLRNA